MLESVSKVGWERSGYDLRRAEQELGEKIKAIPTLEAQRVSDWFTALGGRRTARRCAATGRMRVRIVQSNRNARRAPSAASRVGNTSTFLKRWRNGSMPIRRPCVSGTPAPMAHRPRAAYLDPRKAERSATASGEPNTNKPERTGSKTADFSRGNLEKLSIPTTCDVNKRNVNRKENEPESFGGNSVTAERLREFFEVPKGINGTAGAGDNRTIAQHRAHFGRSIAWRLRSKSGLQGTVYESSSAHPRSWRRAAERGGATAGIVVTRLGTTSTGTGGEKLS